MVHSFHHGVFCVSLFARFGGLSFWNIVNNIILVCPFANISGVCVCPCRDPHGGLRVGPDVQPVMLAANVLTRLEGKACGFFSF